MGSCWLNLGRDHDFRKERPCLIEIRFDMRFGERSRKTGGSAASDQGDGSSRWDLQMSVVVSKQNANTRNSPTGDRGNSRGPSPLVRWGSAFTMDLPSVFPQQRSDDNSLSSQRKAEKHKHDFLALGPEPARVMAPIGSSGKLNLIDSLPLCPWSSSVMSRRQSNKASRPACRRQRPRRLTMAPRTGTHFTLRCRRAGF